MSGSESAPQQVSSSKSQAALPTGAAVDMAATGTDATQDSSLDSVSGSLVSESEEASISGLHWRYIDKSRVICVKVDGVFDREKLPAWQLMCEQFQLYNPESRDAQLIQVNMASCASITLAGIGMLRMLDELEVPGLLINCSADIQQRLRNCQLDKHITIRAGG